MNVRRRILLLAAASFVALAVSACSPLQPVAPAGFPKDFPLPQGRMLGQPDTSKPGAVSFTIEAVEGISQVTAWYEKTLPSTRWKVSTAGRPLFDKDADFIVGDFTDGKQVVTVMITDLGNTTKVGLTATTQ